MNLDTPISLLLISDQPSQANQLLANLRNDGIRLRPEGANTIDGYTKLLNSQTWDLVICFECEKISLDLAVEHLAKSSSETSLIYIAPTGTEDSFASLLALGIADAIAIENESQILASIKRELSLSHFKNETNALTLYLKELENRHHLLLNSASNAISYIQDGIHVYCNQAYADLFTHSSIDDITNTSLLDLVAEKDLKPLRGLLSTPLTKSETIILQAKLKDDNLANIEMAFTPVRYESKDCLQLEVSLASGNIEHAEKRQAIRSQDLLTRLSNKKHFMSKIEDAIANAIQHKALSSIIIVQVNEFVDIKSTIGRSNTNIMLNDISGFLQNSIKKSFTAARLDDYLFALLLDDSNPQEAIELAGFIKSKINNHITSAVLPTMQLSCSIGVAAINGHSLDAEDILSRAKVNLNATLTPSSSSSVFRISDSLNYKVSDMIAYLGLALKENRFRLLFQPLVNIKGNGADGYEILIRMLDSDGNDIPPNEFIPLANLNGMGEEIDKAVFLTALNKIVEDQEQHPKLIISVTNNSMVSPTFLTWLSEQLQTLRIPADLITIQLSEIDICNSLEHAIRFCHGLDELGLRKAVCHFGCALNPLEYLNEIKPNYVKLDRTIIRDIAYSVQRKNSLEELIKDLHKKEFMVVAPQIEDVSLLPLLWKIGADFVQGYCLQGPSQNMNYGFVQDQEITINTPQENHH